MALMVCGLRSKPSIHEGAFDIVIHSNLDITRLHSTSDIIVHGDLQNVEGDDDFGLLVDVLIGQKYKFLLFSGVNSLR